MREAIRTVQQLYPKDMQTLATFARACNDGVLPVTRTLLTESWTRTLVLYTMPVCVYYAIPAV
jgi:hypothetical protein